MVGAWTHSGMGSERKMQRKWAGPTFRDDDDNGLPSSSKSQIPMDYKILLGNTQLYQPSQHTQEIPVSRIFMHPDFEKFHSFKSDIVMVQLHLPVNFTSSIVPVCLPSPEVQLSSLKSCWITCWGMLTKKSECVWERREAEGGEEGEKCKGIKQEWLSSALIS